MKLRVNDSIIVCTGKDKGKTGTISKIFLKTNQVMIEGVNKKIKHKKGREGAAGERVEFFSPIDASNVAILDPKTNKPSRIGYKIENGNRTRIARKSGTSLLEKTHGAAKKVSAPKKSVKKAEKK